MSEALQYLAGDKMRQLIGSLTRTPIRGVFIGALVAMLIQSSSGTTVMTVSFVHAGLMTLKQAVGVIMGANIGTTVIAQIVAFKVKDFALPILGIGVLLVLFGRTKRQKYIGNGLVGFGLLFLGMQTMEGSMSFLRDRKDLFLAFSSSPMLGLFVGTAVTMVVQASSATIGLTMAMAAQGLLPLEAALPILLGDNIGTTITAVLASLGYFGLQRLSEWLTEGTLPVTPAPGPLEWALIALAVVSFGLTAVAQALFPRWAMHPAASGLRVHLSNGLYANAVFDRMVGNWSFRKTR